MADTETPKSGDGSPSDVRPISITEEMKRSYLDYAMSVIVSRALPDVRDGLKPVHRRILYSMHEQGHTPDKKYVKSARVVGDVMGKYHPHGDQAIYDALVRMAQDFSMRLQLIDGQGNFGSVDGDPPAAMRYTECRLAKPAMALLDDIDKDTVDFQANYDGNEREPVVLPARYPESAGQRRRRHRRRHGDQYSAAQSRRSDRRLHGADRRSGDLDRRSDRDRAGAGFPDRRHHPRPRRHPSAPITTGRGSIVMRGKVAFETIRKDREAIIISEIPYQVNKATMVERIAELVREKKIDGIADLRDEIRPRRLPRRDRAEARRRARRRAQPALSLHAAAVLASASTWWRSTAAARW